MRRNIAQREATTQGGRHLTPYHGLVVPPWDDLYDGPAGAGTRVICPRRAEDWTFIPGLPPPSIWVPFDETTGPAVDRGTSGLTLTTTGACVFNVAPPTGFTLPWASIPSPSAAAGFTLPNGVGSDPGQPLFAIFDAQFSATGGTRTLFVMGPNLLLQCLASGFAQLFATGSSLVAGASDYRSATVPFRFCLYWEPGNFGPSNLPVFKLWTRLEQIQITAGSGPGGIIAFPGGGTTGPAGSSSTSHPGGKVRGYALWPGLHARVAANLGGAMQGGKFILQRCGYTVAY